MFQNGTFQNETFQNGTFQNEIALQTVRGSSVTLPSGTVTKWYMLHNGTLVQNSTVYYLKSYVAEQYIIVTIRYSTVEFC
jgi:hypothetical protein